MIIPFPIIQEDTGDCSFCGRRKRDHSDAELDLCWYEIEHSKVVEERINAAKATGLISPKFGVQTFKASDRAIVERNRNAWIKAFLWVAGDYRAMYVWGTPGTGKTYLARCVAFEYITRRDASVCEVTAYQMLKQAVKFEPGAFVKTIERCGLLIIDDIDKVAWNQTGLSFLWSLLNARYENGGRTIITSNVPAKNFRELFTNVDGANLSVVEATLQRLHKILTIEITGGSAR